MSSILDALKKLEEEKASQNTQAIGPGEMDLLRAPTQHGGPPKARALLGLVVIGLVAVVLVLVSVLVSVLFMREETPGQQVASSPNIPAPESDTAITPSVPSTVPAEEIPAPVAEVEESTPAPAEVEQVEATPAPVAVIAPAEKIVVAKAEETPAVTHTPEPEVPAARPVYTRPTPPKPEPVTPEPAPKPRQLALPEDLSTLPLMNHADRDRMGLDELRINLLRPPGERRPVGLAILNLDKVYVGDKIPGTTARLVGVLIDGIAVESTTSGAQYFIEH